jgi:hypothetical protein
MEHRRDLPQVGRRGQHRHHRNGRQPRPRLVHHGFENPCLRGEQNLRHEPRSGPGAQTRRQARQVDARVQQITSADPGGAGPPPVDSGVDEPNGHEARVRRLVSGGGIAEVR